MQRFLAAVFLVLTAVGLIGGCTSAPVVGRSAPALLVGVTPDYPPVVYKQGERVTGIEADLARRLGQALGRPVEFVELAWDDLVPALLDSRIDVIMSGMSMTDARAVRIAFSDAYMRNSLVAAVPRKNLADYPTRESILQTHLDVGVLRGSSAEAFATREMKLAGITRLDKMADAGLYFGGNRIRAFIGDVCAVAWLVSENEAELAGVWIPLLEERVGWGFRKEDAALRESANRVLAGWKADGTLKSILTTHVPYLDRMEWEVP